METLLGRDLALDYPNYGGEERRGQHRLEVAVSCLVDDGKYAIPGQIVELSSEGAFIECELAPPQDAPVTIRLENVSLPGHVRHSGWYLVQFHKGFYLGIEFQDADAVTQHRLRTLIEQHGTGQPLIKFQLP